MSSSSKKQHTKVSHRDSSWPWVRTAPTNATDDAEWCGIWSSLALGNTSPAVVKPKNVCLHKRYNMVLQGEYWAVAVPNMVLPVPGPIINNLCPPAAATSSTACAILLLPSLKSLHPFNRLQMLLAELAQQADSVSNRRHLTQTFGRINISSLKQSRLWCTLSWQHKWSLRLCVSPCKLFEQGASGLKVPIHPQIPPLRQSSTLLI